jgi:hypothetical protein
MVHAICQSSEQIYLYFCVRMLTGKYVSDTKRHDSACLRDDGAIFLGMLHFLV